jgi:pimeloyl-ACP methyl ester carboxylesterase
MIGSTVTLPDGRALGYAEWGDPGGEPMLFFHGSPGSRLTRPVGSMVVPGVRVLSVERPGHGLSDPQPGRALLDWPADVAAFADALGLDRFFVQGVSGGGPSAAVCAFALGQRVRGAALVCTAGDPAHVDVVTGMGDMNAMLFTMAREDPEQLRGGLEMMASAFTEGGVEVMRAGMGDAAPADQLAAKDDELMAMLAESSAEAFAQGVDGALQDLALFVTPWGFDASAITVPVVVAHGTDDRNVPIQNGEWLAATIPGATYLRHDGEAHLSLLTNHAATITRTLLDLG